MLLTELANLYKIKESVWKESENVYNKMKTGDTTRVDYDEYTKRYKVAEREFSIACRSYAINQLVNKRMIP